jgi:hypothetical protein
MLSSLTDLCHLLYLSFPADFEAEEGVDQEPPVCRQRQTSGACEALIPQRDLNQLSIERCFHSVPRVCSPMGRLIEMIENIVDSRVTVTKEMLLELWRSVPLVSFPFFSIKYLLIACFHNLIVSLVESLFFSLPLFLSFSLPSPCFPRNQFKTFREVSCHWLG